MEQTKAFVVESTNIGFMYGSRAHCVFFNKEDAEFYSWLKNNEEKKDKYTWGGLYYSVLEVKVSTIDKNNKDYKKFVNDRLEKVNAQIKEKEECAEKDEKAIAELSKEKEYYDNLLK